MSLMQAKWLTRTAASLNDFVSGQVSGGLSKKLSSMPVVSKNEREMHESATVRGSDFSGCEPQSDLLLDSSCVFSSDVKSSEKSASVASS
jgi:hypothetical protein